MADPMRQEPIGGNFNKGPQLLAVLWSETSIAFTVVCLRVFARAKYVKKFWWDDWLMFFTMLLMLIYTGFWTAYALKDGARHVYYLTYEQQVETTRLNWISQAFCVTAIGTGKASVAYFLLRILGPSKWRRPFLHFIAFSSVIVCSIDIILTFAQCTPVQKLWNPLRPGHCWKPYIQPHFALFVGAYLALMDFVLALLPITIIWGLQLNKKKRLGLITIMGLGVFAGICAIVKTSQLPSLGAQSDFTWITVGLLIWTHNEIFVIIVAACVPTLRPLFLDLVEKFNSNVLSRNSSSPLSKKGAYKLQDASSPRNSGKRKSGFSQDDMVEDKLRPVKTMQIKQTREWIVRDVGSNEDMV